MFWGTGEKGDLLQGNRGTKAKLLGEQGNKDNIGEQGTSQFISGEQGNISHYCSTFCDHNKLNDL